MRSATRKSLSALGMLAVGDALAFAVNPREHVRVWTFRRAPAFLDRVGSALTATRARVLAAAGVELAIGVALLSLARKGIR